MNQKVNPLIAMIPLASLVALIIVVVNLFPDDALAGMPIDRKSVV